MNFIVANWRTIGALALLVALAFGSYRHGVDTTTTKYELQITQERLAAETAKLKAFTENEAAKARLQGEKHVAQKRINDLAVELAGLRVLLPGCGDIMPVPGAAADPTGGSTQATAGGESLPRPAETAQGALDTFMAASDADAHAADSLVNECRIVYKWARGLSQ